MQSVIEQTRLRISNNTTAKKKSQLGQFFTPISTAQFMASLFSPTNGNECRLIDAGAGIGSLSSAFLERCVLGELNFVNVELTAFEFDTSLHEDLKNILSRFMNQIYFSYNIVGGDFIENAINRIQFGHCDFTHAILNPPYKKINSNSRDRHFLRLAGIETVNLYSAFVALVLLLLAPGGEVVAIIPRSFCNGPYYRPFRDFILKRAAIKRIHLFDSRNSAFKDDEVLQENIIIHLERDGQQGPVTISTSTDNTFVDLFSYESPFNRILLPEDQERFIHIPTTSDINVIEQSQTISFTLADLGIDVSTGPVVDFRCKEYVRSLPEPGTVPLLYPIHFSNFGIDWPKGANKKQDSLQLNQETKKWLYPIGYYCVVRRFSSKEEKHRIVASVVDPGSFPGTTMLGFENHLNVFHEKKHGLPEALARGLAVFLNTTAIDDYFRRFSGHTQVNATDLRLMKFPNRKALIALGLWARDIEGPLTQTMIDERLWALNT